MRFFLSKGTNLSTVLSSNASFNMMRLPRQKAMWWNAITDSSGSMGLEKLQISGLELSSKTVRSLRHAVRVDLGGVISVQTSRKPIPLQIILCLLRKSLTD